MAFDRIECEDLADRSIASLAIYRILMEENPFLSRWYCRSDCEKYVKVHAFFWWHKWSEKCQTSGETSCDPQRQLIDIQYSSCVCVRARWMKLNVTKANVFANLSLVRRYAVANKCLFDFLRNSYIHWQPLTSIINRHSYGKLISIAHLPFLWPILISKTFKFQQLKILLFLPPKNCGWKYIIMNRNNICCKNTYTKSHAHKKNGNSNLN